MLLCVLESKGSSPGRRGFKMAVCADGDFTGTIGGGIMEYKLVEKAKSLLKKRNTANFIMHQYHDKEHTTSQSGMICSGSQAVAFIYLKDADADLMKHLANHSPKENHLSFKLSSSGIGLTETAHAGFIYKNKNEWLYEEPLFQQPVLHVIGGGHVSFALCELMQMLGFYIKVYDDRPGLNTLQANRFANEKILVNYDKINDYLNIAPTDYVVIMTIGYRTDKIILQQLLGEEIYYLGMLGSERKIESMFSEMREEGVKDELLKKVFTPIGINIFSQTTKEIAVSIAAEIIREKNKNLPKGRSDTFINE